MYRFSNYNLLFKAGENDVIYNTLTNKFEIYNNVNIEDIDPDKIDMTKKKDMIKSGILTKLSKDEEHEYCNSLFYQKMYGNILNITLVTTRMCNFECVYCAQRHENLYMDEKVYEAVLKLIVRNIANFHMLKIILFGGEPTLAINKYTGFLKEIKKICKFYKKQFYISMISNGYLLNYDIMTDLYYNLGITNYQITLDGSPNIHNSNRHLKGGKTTYEEIYKNLLMMLSRKDMKKLLVAIRINTSQEMIKSLETWKENYEPFLEDRRFFINLGVVENRGGDRIDEFQDGFVFENDEYFKYAKKELNEHDFYEDQMVANYFVCKDITKNSYTIDYNGDVRLCSNIMKDNIIGKLRTDGHIIKSKDVTEFYLNVTKCKGCVVEPLCHGKNCGLQFICNKNEIIELIKENVKKKLENSNH